MSDLTLITGVMGSGKTDKLIQLYKKLSSDPSNKILCFKPTMDTRDNNIIKSRTGEVIENVFLISSSQELDSILSKSLHPFFYYPRTEKIYLFFSEAQFFNENIIKTINFYHHQGFNIYIEGLTTDFQHKTFGYLNKLNTSYLINLVINCEFCKNYEAEVNYRLSDNNNQVVLGGSELYKAICVSCWNQTKLKPTNQDLKL